jgi:hypothetical protein
MTVQWNSDIPNPWGENDDFRASKMTKIMQNIFFLLATQQVDDGSEVTISSGTATMASNAGRFTVDTESDASEDNLDNFGGLEDGQIAYVFPASASRTVIIRDGEGNIDTQGWGDEIKLRELNQFAVVIRFGSTYLVLFTNVPLKYTLQFPILHHDASLVTGDGQWEWPVPDAFEGYSITEAHSLVSSASTSGLPEFQLYHSRHANDILSTAITIDANEKSSRDAATPPVINSSYNDLQGGDVIRGDCDGDGTGTTGWWYEITLEKI